MQLKDVMTRNVEVVHPDATLQEAAAKMDALDVGPLPVSDGTQVLGVLTDRDITVRATATGQDPKVALVRDFMSRDMVYAFEDQDVMEAARLMQEKQIRRLLVLDRDNRLVGIVSLGDLAVQTGDDRLTAVTLEGVSEPSQPDR